MRMILYISKKAKILIALLLFFASIGAYPQTCEVTLRNDFLIDANNLIVDIYVKAISGNFYYSQGQYKVQFDIPIKNGGTITGAIVHGYSDLTNSAQIPTTVNITTSTFRVPTEFQPSTQEACSQISTTGFGTRICRVKLTNTVAFGVLTANMTLLTTTGVPTTVWYTNSSNFGVEIIPTTVVNTNLVNPILNGTLTAYNVTGSGTAPAAVGLDGSQTGGVNYVLYKNAVPQGASIDGTGSAITFGTQPEGTYTVKGHRTATFMYSDMTGNATVTRTDLIAYAVTGGGSYCQEGVGLPVGLANSESGVIYTLIKDGADQVPTVTGTGAPITFGNKLLGTYTVRGTNDRGTIAMEGSAVITVNTAPGAPTGTATQSFCSGASPIVANLAATGTSIQWYAASNGGSALATSTPLVNGTHYYASQTVGVCESSARFDVTATVNTTPGAPTVGTIMQPTCAVATGRVILSGLPSGTWTINPGSIVGSTTSTTISELATGTYTYTVTNASGCTSSASANVVIIAQPVTPTAPTVGTITQPTCAVATGSVVLSGLPATGTWTLTRTPGGTTSAGTGTSTTISGLAAGTYTYTVTNASGCTSVASVNVVIIAQPETPTAPTVGTITQPTCVVATGSVVFSGLPATGTWTLTRTPDGTTTTGTGISSTITGLEAGIYTYIVSNSSGCTSAASANVVIEVAKIGVVPKIKFKFGDLLICYNLGDSIKSYQWYKGVDPISNAILQYYQTKGQSGTYKVKTIDKNECKNFSNEISTSGAKSLSVYPNPASVSFTLKLSDESGGRAVVSIINSAGIKVMEFQVENINDELLKEIPVNNLDEGIYFVQVLLDHKDLYYTKIVVIK